MNLEAVEVLNSVQFFLFHLLSVYTWNFSCRCVQVHIPFGLMPEPIFVLAYIFVNYPGTIGVCILLSEKKMGFILQF